MEPKCPSLENTSKTLHRRTMETPQSLKTDLSELIQKVLSDIAHSMTASGK